MVPLPPLYKYLDVRGAKLTLGNGTFKHAKPSDFKDIEDLTIQSIFPQHTEAALTKLANGFIDVILHHLDDPPTCSPSLRKKLTLIQLALRTNPDAAELVKAELNREGRMPIYDVEHMRELSEAFVKEVNQFMQDYRVFCVTTNRASEEMWTNYAENHRGVVLRIESNVAKDSKFQLFRPVEYREKRPTLYNDTLEFLAGSLFGDHEARRKESVEKVIYTKTLAWQHEAEYRLAIPILPGEAPWDILKYHPEEVTELYLGFAMADDDKDEVVSKAKALNKAIVVFQMRRDKAGQLAFDQV